MNTYANSDENLVSSLRRFFTLLVFHISKKSNIITHYIATNFLGHGTVNPKANELRGGAGLENPPQRWSAKRKAEVFLCSLRGEALDALSYHTAVPVPRLEDWRERGLHGLEQALQTREPGDPAQVRLDEANRQIGELSMEVELLRARCEKAGPFAGRRSRTSAGAVERSIKLLMSR